MRRVLREYYVGAILVGFLLYNFVTEIIRSIENPIMLWIQRMVQHSALSAGQPWFNKGQLVASLVDAAFYLIAAVLIGLWIYRSAPAPEPVTEKA